MGYEQNDTLTLSDSFRWDALEPQLSAPVDPASAAEVLVFGLACVQTAAIVLTLRDEGISAIAASADEVARARPDQVVLTSVEAVERFAAEGRCSYGTLALLLRDEAEAARAEGLNAQRLIHGDQDPSLVLFGLRDLLLGR